MKKVKRKIKHMGERKERFALTLLISGFVFVINTIDLLLAIVIIIVFSKLNIIHVTEGQVRLNDVLWLLSICSLILGFLITTVTSKITMKPVNRMINQLNRLAQGDFKARLHFGKPISSHPAFQEIEKSFNRAAEELEHTEILQSDFINNFSHEFKTPIVSIAGFAKLLRHGNLTEEEKNEYLTVVEEESRRLADMSANILNLTNIENQKVLTDITNFNLSEQIRGAVLLLVEKWTHKNLDIDMELDEFFIEGNEEMLKQVWINLFDNAIKFSEPNGKVSVSITDNEESVCVSVTNHGEEIPKESMKRIFNKFYQVDESRSSEGCGIGLTIVKKVCDLHKGELFVMSENHTTTFTVILPKRQH